jgi:hypothetical protein
MIVVRHIPLKMVVAICPGSMEVPFFSIADPSVFLAAYRDRATQNVGRPKV